MKDVFLRFPGFRKRAVCLSYDDGTVHDRRLLEILDRYGLRATVHLNSGLFGTPGRLSETEAVALYAGGRHEIALHGRNHIPFTELPEDRILWEVLSDRERLETLFGRMVRGLAYPDGRYDSQTADLLRTCGIRYARTTETTGRFELPSDWLALHPTCRHCDVGLMELVESFLTEKPTAYFWSGGPKVFILFGHSFEFEEAGNWDLAEQFAATIGRRENIFYTTLGELCEYDSAYRRLEYSADGSKVFNPTCRTIWLNNRGKEIVLGAGKTEILA